MSAKNYINDLFTAINHDIITNSQQSITANNKMLTWDKPASHSKHAIWSALTILTEISLPVDTRYTGYQALLWYDTLKDQSIALPETVSTAVRHLIAEMSFHDFVEEQLKVWQCSDMTKLLKLYTKVAVIYDEDEININLRKILVAFTLKLADYIHDVYGNLNIVQIAQTICRKY